MAGGPGSTFSKRQKERARQERQREKLEKKRQRREEKKARALSGEPLPPDFDLQEEEETAVHAPGEDSTEKTPE